MLYTFYSLLQRVIKRKLRNSLVISLDVYAAESIVIGHTFFLTMLLLIGLCVCFGC
jgi:hypothetical protein